MHYIATLMQYLSLYHPTRVSDSKSIFMGSQNYQNYQSKRSLHVRTSLV
jgi:hypothetical protein